MAFLNLLPRTLVACLTVGILVTSTYAQTRPRTTAPADQNEVSCTPDDHALISTEAAVESKPVWEAKPAKPTIDITQGIGSPIGGFKLQPMLLAAIDERLGSPYRWGGTGPVGFGPSHPYKGCVTDQPTYPRDPFGPLVRLGSN